MSLAVFRVAWSAVRVTMEISVGAPVLQQLGSDVLELLFFRQFLAFGDLLKLLVDLWQFGGVQAQLEMRLS